MDSRPTLYLSNWSSHRTPGAYGPGRRFTIMAKPRRWERGDGLCRRLAPLSGVEPALLANALEGRRPEAVAAYRAALEARWGSDLYMLQPGLLTAIDVGAGAGYVVADGDTLCCACAVAEARAGRCRRAWAAPFLVRAGWRVVLDGEEVHSQPSDRNKSHDADTARR